MNKKKKICIVTTTRSDYGLLYWLMKEIERDKQLCLQLIVSGTHVEPEFGNTYRIIEKDGFNINKKIFLSMKGEGALAAAHSLAKGFSGFAKAYVDLKPDLVVVLGDRYELVAPVVAAVLSNIPIAHIHGGEATEGAVDDAIRHAITKLSCLHFASTETYRRRIIQMGENPKRVFCFGAPGIDNIYKLKLLSKKELQDYLSFSFKSPFALLTYHPATLEKKNAGAQIKIILSALKNLRINGLFTMANADSGGSVINHLIMEFCEKNPQRFIFVKNLGQIVYLSCMKHCDLIIGNSSSGIIESSSFGVPVVDIGTRQKGRLRAENVLHADLSCLAIKKTIQYALLERFKQKAKKTKNPYDFFRDEKVSMRIKNELKRVLLNGIVLNKSFYDLKCNEIK